jgi:hypothetical protein
MAGWPASHNGCTDAGAPHPLCWDVGLRWWPCHEILCDISSRRAALYHLLLLSQACLPRDRRGTGDLRALSGDGPAPLSLLRRWIRWLCPSTCIYWSANPGGRISLRLSKPWSSFRHWWTGGRGTVEIESQWTATRREVALLKPMSQNQGHGAPDSVRGS